MKGYTLRCPYCGNYYTGKSWYIKHIQRDHKGVDWKAVFEDMADQQDNSDSVCR